MLFWEKKNTRLEHDASTLVNRQSTPQERFSLLALAGEQQAFAGELVWRKASFPFFQIILKFGVRNKLKGFPKPSIPVLLPRDSSPEAY